jgi:hypothetical protein
LPYFHILACRHGGERDVPAVVDLCMELLIQLIGIPGETLAIVSTEKLLPHRTILEHHGVSTGDRVIIREIEQARFAGDGSGYFAPTGHPAAIEVHTAGVYAWVGKGTPQPVSQYPVPKGWVEVAEIALERDAPSSFGIGLERVALAKNGPPPSWQDSLAELLSRIETEARESEKALPPAYDMFREIRKP